MLYHLTRSIIQLALDGYFKNIEVIGEEHMPAEGPTIFIANHPSALIDPLIISIIVKRKMHFLAGAEFFGSGFKSWLLRDQFNMIPVYRPKSFENQKVDNHEMFAACYECLEKGGSFLIFPEGISVTENRLKPFKTGIARILLGAHELHPDLDVKVCPIGLNYDDPHSFQDSVTVKIGKSVKLSDFPKIDLTSETAAREISDALETELKKLVVHIENPELDRLISQVSRLYRHNLEKELGLTGERAERKFQLQQQIAKAISHFHEHSPEVVKQTGIQIRDYFDQIKTFKIREHYLEKQVAKTRKSDYMLLAVLFPIFVFGIVLTGLPYLVSKSIFQNRFLPRIKNQDHNRHINPAFSGTISFSIGTSIFLIWFLLISVVVGIGLGSILGALCFFALYILGQSTLWYLTTFLRVFFRWKHRRTMKVHATDLKILIEKRQGLLELLNKHKTAYEQARDQKAAI